MEPHVATEIARLKKRIEKLEIECRAMKEIIKVQEAFQTGGKFITWLAKVAGAAMLLYGAFKLAVTEWGVKP